MCYNGIMIWGNAPELRKDDFMALVTSTEMFKKAYAGGYAIGAFNVNNM